MPSATRIFMGSLPTTRVRRRIFRLTRSMTLLVRILVQRAGELTVGQGFLNTVLHLFGSFFQLHLSQLSRHSFCLFTGGVLALLGVDRLEHLGRQLHFGAGDNGEHVA